MLYALYAGTHDVQNISVTSPRPGEILVTGDIIANSAVTGVLVIVISNFKQLYHLIPRRSDGLYFEDTVIGVAGGDNSVSLFVVEEDELLINGAASWPQLVSVRTSKFNIMMSM